jgi:hypothetical protein
MNKLNLLKLVRAGLLALAPRHVFGARPAGKERHG